jgi:uncharacterized protein with PQ loop repeat
MLVQLIQLIGVIASTATCVMVAVGQGGQLLRIKRCSAIEVHGIHCGAFALNALSHCLWSAFGLGIQSMVIFVPNLLGALLSFLIVWRVVAIRRLAANPPARV